MSKLISIIIPLYNKEKYILRCLNSLINQNYSDFELIIVDDGSTDNSYQLVKQINDKRIKLFSINNSGVSNARNYGLRKATGDYITFVDPDDYVSPDYLNPFFSIQTSQTDLIVCGHIEVQDDIQVEKKLSFYNGDVKNLPKEFFLNGFCHPVWGKFYKRNIINKFHIEFKNISISEDSFFNIIYLEYIKTVTFLSKCNYYYVKYPCENTLSNKAEFNYLDIYDELYSNYNSYFETKSSNYSREIIYPQYYNLIIRLIKKYSIKDLSGNTTIDKVYKDSLISAFNSHKATGFELILKKLIIKKQWLILKMLFKFIYK